ncbi:N-acetyltransferase [Phytohabitans kaempferiae]|uniref:N-acetyltransferase n=1 Tax=Phytohabitans kaempferiae TaxID=1620943 RepID=A0ABV6MG83_9ACTN
MDLQMVTLAERPDLTPLLDDLLGTWPRFLHHHPLSTLFYSSVAPRHPGFCLVAVERGQQGRLVAKAYSVPVAWPPGTLPAEGHDAAIMAAAGDLLDGRPGLIVVALEVTVAAEWQGRGVSRIMLDALRANAARHGFGAILVPVRPTHKHLEPDLPLAAYVARTRPDGLPHDPWLRTHVRAGGEIVGIAPASMTLTAPLADWREWTGLPFDTAGPVHVPEALVPVHCDPAQDCAVYVEPNVWVRHQLHG